MEGAGRPQLGEPRLLALLSLGSPPTPCLLPSVPVNGFDLQPWSLTSSAEAPAPQLQPPATGGVLLLKGLIQPLYSSRGDLEKKINITFPCWGWLLHVARPAWVSQDCRARSKGALGKLLGV